MTTVAESRAALISLLGASALDVTSVLGAKQPPYVAVLGDGIDTTGRAPAGQGIASWRCALIAGKSDQEASAASLDALKQYVAVTIRAAPGWQLGEIRRDGIRSIAGGLYLTADIIANQVVNIE